MKFTSNKFKLINSLTLIILFSLAFGYIGNTDSFAADKEELKLQMENAPFGKEIAEKQEMMIPQKPLPPKESIEKPDMKYSLNIKEKGPGKKEPKTKKVFKPEIGLVEVIQPASYGVLSLEDCIKIAVKNHLPLQIAEKNIALAKMRIFEARRNMLPTLTIGYEESAGRVLSREYVGRKQYLEGQQPIFHGGELYFTMKQTEKNLGVVKNDYDRIKNELVLQVKKGYYTLAKAKENMKMQVGLSKDINKIMDRVSKQFEAGLTSKSEYLNVSSQTSQVGYQLLSAQGDESVAELILKQAMNIDPKDVIQVESNLEFKKVDVDYEKALRMALVNRPEMKINSLMIDYYNYGKSIAKAKGWPKIDFLGSWGLAKEEYSSEDMIYGGPNADPDRKLEQQWYAGIKTSIPLWGSTAEYSWTHEEWTPVVSAYHGTEAVTDAVKFKILDKLDYFSDRQLADIDFFRARQELIKVRQDITLEVKEQCFNYEKALRQLETATSKVKFQESDVEVKSLRRQMEEAQDSDVIEAMIKLSQEKFGYLQALADCQISLAAINKAVGMENYLKNN